MLDEHKLGIAGRVAKTFLRSKLTPLVVLASIVLGIFAVLLTPREEEPQIIVPMVDVLVPFPGAGAAEVESQVTTPLERRLWGIPGIEYLYSTSRTGAAFITVRFKVNEPLEPSMVKVRQELDAHPELLPSSALRPVVRLLTIDDVPFLTLTLHGGELPGGELRKLSEEVARELAVVPDTAQVRVLGGARRVVRIEPDPARLRSLQVSLAELQRALEAADAQRPAGALVEGGRRTELEVTGFLRSSEELGRVVVRASGERPIYVRDVATVIDGPEPEPAVILVARKEKAGFEQAVSIALAKRAGVNATALARRVLEKIQTLRGGLIPDRVQVEVTRNYGETANDKSNELIEHLLIATLSVIALISLAMGWRSGLIVAMAVPVTLALTLLLTFLFGYTLNRVTLFALIFSIGILVDDAIVVVENIHRHLHLPGPPRSFVRTVIDAVDEVGNPTVLATLAVIAAILPMAFVRGLMGPYMRPIPVGASAAMLFSLAIAFIVSPWAALRVFRREVNLPATDALGLHPGDPEVASPEPIRDAPTAHTETMPESRLTRIYRRGMSTLLRSALARWAFLAVVVVLLGGAMALVATGVVKVKMLPFDNKSEFLVQLDLPAGTAREEALALGQQLARRLLEEPEVSAIQVHSGVAAPFSFVGMVRHAFLRDRPEQVDLQVQLLPKGSRKAQSHPIAMRIRPHLEQLAQPAGARLKIVEIPPGPPVLDTLVAEVYGPTREQRDAYAGEVLAAFRSTPGVVDIDSSLNPTAPRLSLAVDREKAALHGVSPAAVVQTLSAASEGSQLGSLHVERGATQVPMMLQLAVANRTLADVLQLTVPGTRGAIPLSELVRARAGVADPDIFHKNLMPVAYVFGDVAGVIESPIYALIALNKKLDSAATTEAAAVPRFGLAHPSDTEQLALKWDGEWHITLEVFRDLGLAFAAVLLLIYVLVVGWFESFSVPLVILVPIPLSLIGILPAHGMFGVFFTATSMIGFIAGAGIIVRNSIILVDFIELKLREGMPLALAVEEAGVVRFRPMLLTAAAVMAGSAVMLADPIFQGLAMSLMAGEVAATLLSRAAVPVLYFLLARRGRAATLHRQKLPVAFDDPPATIGTKDGRVASMATDDHDLLAAARCGDARSVDALLARHQKQIFRFGLRMCGNEDEAREVLQETLLAAFRGLHEFREDAQLSTWLYQIARSFCLKSRRRTAGEPEQTVPIEKPEARAVPASDAAPDAKAHAREMGELLQAAIRSLSERQREVLVLRDVEGLSAEEAAHVIGIEVGALKSRLHRARAELRERLVAVLGDDSELGGEAPCPELADELAADEIDQATCARIEEHLQRCPRCAKACAGLQRTVSFCKEIPGGEVPAPVRAAVRSALLAATQKAGGG